MKKNDVFTFTAPNGAEATGVVVDVVAYKERDDFFESVYDDYLCYAQNRLFHYLYVYDGPTGDEWQIGSIILDYCIIPEYDAMLEEAYLNKHEEETL